MEENDAIRQVKEIVGSETFERIELFTRLVVSESQHQNLVASSTISTLWARHVLDSVQLLRFLKENVGPVLDIGTGGGFPGVILALATRVPTVLCEPRRRRAEFLARACRLLRIENAEVVQGKVDLLSGTFRAITARAVAPPSAIVEMSWGQSERGTRWILPAGRLSDRNQHPLPSSKALAFHVEQSITDPASKIIIIDRQR